MGAGTASRSSLRHRGGKAATKTSAVASKRSRLAQRLARMLLPAAGQVAARPQRDAPLARPASHNVAILNHSYRGEREGATAHSIPHCASSTQLPANPLAPRGGLSLRRPGASSCSKLDPNPSPSPSRSASRFVASATSRAEPTSPASLLRSFIPSRRGPAYAVTNSPPAIGELAGRARSTARASGAPRHHVRRVLRGAICEGGRGPRGRPAPARRRAGC